MSQENVEIVVKQIEATNARNFATAMDAYAENVTLIVHWEVMTPTAAGKTAVGEWFGDWFRQFGPDYHFDIEESRGIDDRVFLVATHHGRGRGSGALVEQRMAYVYTVREGKVSRLELWGGADCREAALEAVGLSEQAISPEGGG
jgi:ketosteroid isomerase-like protein